MKVCKNESTETIETDCGEIIKETITPLFQTDDDCLNEMVFITQTTDGDWVMGATSKSGGLYILQRDPHLLSFIQLLGSFDSESTLTAVQLHERGIKLLGNVYEKIKKMAGDKDDYDLFALSKFVKECLLNASMDLIDIREGAIYVDAVSQVNELLGVDYNYNLKSYKRFLENASKSNNPILKKISQEDIAKAKQIIQTALDQTKSVLQDIDGE